MNGNLGRLADAGVAIWLDDLNRDMLDRGELAELVRTCHVVGVTTNPTIFQKAIEGSQDYTNQLRDLAARELTAGEALRMITTADVRRAADVLRPVYDSTGGRDGWVSIEVDPRLAHAVVATVAEARQLAWLVDRPNAFIKIPATAQGLSAITAAIADGISVNVTLVFSLDRYREVIDAYSTGLEAAHAAGHDLSTIRSVASFFVSRVDTEVDKRLDKVGTAQANALRGKAAIANARLAYNIYTETLTTPRWTSLAAAGANAQRPLWASTGVKDPAYDDTRYVADLVAPDVVNTMPRPTLNAVADHAQIVPDSVTSHYEQSKKDLDALAPLGVSYDEVVHQLEDEGVAKFATSWNELLDSVHAELAHLAVRHT